LQLKLSYLFTSLKNTVAVSALKREEKRPLRKFMRTSKYEGNMAMHLKEIKCDNVDWINVA
jgi:hypothetical protein